MSILINGMEMPKEDSWITVRIYPDGTCAVPNWQGDCTFIKGAKAIPAADVRPVVLCKNCKHRPAKKDGRIIAPKDANGYTDYKCPFVCEDSWYNRMTADDDYCSCGEKREE